MMEISDGTADWNSGWYYVAICASFSLGSVLHRSCELRWPNRGGSIAAIPLATLMLLTEIAYMVTECPLEIYIHIYIYIIYTFFAIRLACLSTSFCFGPFLALELFVIGPELFAAYLWKLLKNKWGADPAANVRPRHTST